MHVMAKMGKAAASKTRHGDEILGRARDGVWIIKPTVKPTHFSPKEAATSVSKVLRESHSGRFVGSSADKYK